MTNSKVALRASGSKVFLDMDNVLVDFNKGLEEFNIVNDVAFIHKPRSEWTELQIKLDKAVVDCMNTPGFFRGLPMMEGADKLWSMAGKPYVLTAWPATSKDRQGIGNEKREWIEEYFGQLPEDRFIYCSREDKAKYAIGNILVDDMESNCQSWTDAGGEAILFKNANQALNDLQHLLHKELVRFDVV